MRMRFATGILGILMQPWNLLSDPTGYIFDWLVGYSGGLGSIAGVLIADYWFMRRTTLRLADLYRPDAAYRYAGVLAGASRKIGITRDRRPGAEREDLRGCRERQGQVLRAHGRCGTQR